MHIPHVVDVWYTWAQYCTRHLRHIWVICAIRCRWRPRYTGYQCHQDVGDLWSGISQVCTWVGRAIVIPRRRELPEERFKPAESEPVVVPLASMIQLEHLLRVAVSVTQDAEKTWAEIWSEFKPLVTSDGMIRPEAAQGFTPSCGWPEFLEKLWLLKHYLDSVQRICTKQH
jgi:hypothetical protein